MGEGGRGKVCPYLFQKLEKVALTLGKNALIVVSYGLNVSFDMYFLRVYPGGPFISCVVHDYLSKCPDSSKTSLRYIYIYIYIYMSIYKCIYVYISVYINVSKRFKAETIKRLSTASRIQKFGRQYFAVFRRPLHFQIHLPGPVSITPFFIHSFHVLALVCEQEK